MYWFQYPRLEWWSLPAGAVLVAAVLASPWALRLERRWFLAAAVVMALVTRVALNMSRFGPHELIVPLVGRGDATSTCAPWPASWTIRSATCATSRSWCERRFRSTPPGTRPARRCCSAACTRWPARRLGRCGDDPAGGIADRRPSTCWAVSWPTSPRPGWPCWPGCSPQTCS